MRAGASGRCPAGAGMPGTVTYGISLQAWCVYLMAAHAIPVHRCAELIGALTGARPSPGFVHSLLARAAAAVKHANQLIRALIITASVICADETPIRVGPGPKTRKRYLLVACTNLLTYYLLGDRSLATFVEHPGFGGDSILPRCSGLGGRCLPRYRRLAEPRSDHFSAFVLSNICPAALSSCPAWWRAPPARPPSGAWASPRRAPAVRRGFPGRGKGDAQRHRLRRRRRP